MRGSHVALLKELGERGMALTGDEVGLLVEVGVMTPQEGEARIDHDQKRAVFGELDRDVLQEKEYLDRCKGIKVPDVIRKEDWDCREPAEFDEGFVRFILSHKDRFCDLAPYRPLYLYITQARRWMDDEVPDLSMMDDYTRRAWYRREADRYDQNSMYGLMRELKYKEADAEEGERAYEPTMAMWLMSFLFDQRRCMAIAKGRQISSTTFFTGAAALKVARRPNLHVKFIACDLQTTEEIFEDKLKFAFGRFSKWVRPVVINDKDNMLRVAFKRGAAKGTRKAVTSRVSVNAPSASAINGGAPDIIEIDEAPFLPGRLFDDIMREGRPVLFKKVDGRLRLRRQFIAWGTGGRAVTSNSTFEKFHRTLFESWAQGDTSEGIVPIFLDWTCRPGVTIEFYRQEMARVMASVRGKSDADRESAIIQFRQTMPSSLDDVYAVDSNTIVPMSFIAACSDRCDSLPMDLKGHWGRFEPLYDTSERMHADCVVPFRIRGAQWVPADEGDISAPVFMFMPPEKGWAGRWYQGTDPILAAQGLSMQASVIWDAELRTIPCVVMGRTNDPYDMYMQTKLMGMYYANDGEQACPELVENNIGKAYIKWMEAPEWRQVQSLLTNNRLIDILQGGGEVIGIDTKGARKNTLVTGIGKNMLLSHGRNIYIPMLWSQLRFFTGTVGASGRVLWGVDDRKNHQDDLVDAAFIAYACRMSFPAISPRRTVKEDDGEDGQGGRLRYKLMFDRRSGRNIKVPVRADKGNLAA